MNAIQTLRRVQNLAKKWAILINFLFAFAAILLTVLNIWYTRVQIANSQKTAHFDVIPSISCRLEFPPVLEGTNVSSRGINPEVQILNLGPIKVDSLAVVSEIFTFYPKTTNSSQWMKERDANHDFLFFETELPVAKHLKTQLIATTDAAVYVFHISYFRESDMHQFTKKEFFFVEDGRIADHKSFKAHPLYEAMMRSIYGSGKNPFLRTNSYLIRENLLK